MFSAKAKKIPGPIIKAVIGPRIPDFSSNSTVEHTLPLVREGRLYIISDRSSDSRIVLLLRLPNPLRGQ